MIKNIIFDIGQVLLSYTPYEYVHSIIDNQTKAERLLSNLFLSSLWLDLDRGIKTYEDVLQELLELNPEDIESYKFLLEHWTDMLLPIQSNVDLLKSLNQYNLYYLSNFQCIAFHEIITKHDFFQLFIGGIVSFKEHLMKPEPEIYETLLAKYNLLPTECIFIDDSYPNIEAAHLLGFHAIHFTPSCNLRSEIDCIIEREKTKEFVF